jgi:hypothetical protein
MVEWFWQGEIEVLGDKCIPESRLKSHMHWPGIEPGPPQLEAGDLPPETQRGLFTN